MKSLLRHERPTQLYSVIMSTVYSCVMMKSLIVPPLPAAWVPWLQTNPHLPYWHLGLCRPWWLEETKEIERGKRGHYRLWHEEETCLWECDWMKIYNIGLRVQFASHPLLPEPTIAMHNQIVQCAQLFVCSNHVGSSTRAWEANWILRLEKSVETIW